jgi:hypothetical protein
MKITRFAFFVILLAASTCWTGCEMFASHTNPIAGWKVVPVETPDKAITKDYQDYIQQLPAKERKFTGALLFLENGTGQHAITIIVNLYGTEWTYVLVYDKEDKRIKVKKYVSGHYAS